MGLALGFLLLVEFLKSHPLNLEGGIPSVDELLRVDDFPDDWGDEFDDGLIDLVELVLVVAEQRTQNHKDGACVPVELTGGSDPVQHFGDVTGEDSADDGVLGQQFPEVCAFVVVLLIG
jgi:hypothetical protein